jgi:hypothetical protein
VNINVHYFYGNIQREIKQGYPRLPLRDLPLSTTFLLFHPDVLVLKEIACNMFAAGVVLI